jgi:hypothetical protein
VWLVSKDALLSRIEHEFSHRFKSLKVVKNIWLSPFTLNFIVPCSAMATTAKNEKQVTREMVMDHQPQYSWSDDSSSWWSCIPGP